MNSFVVGIDRGEKERDACYMSPDGEIKNEMFHASLDNIRN